MAYLRHAFFYKWNVLMFLGGLGAAALSPFPDAFIPFVCAIEAAYLGGVISSPRFREAIDAREFYRGKPVPPQKATANRTLTDIVKSLPFEARTRFERIRTRCLEMRGIAAEVRGRMSNETRPGEDFSTSSLDRLLWVFLRLLLADEALSRFLSRTDINEIRSRLTEIKARLEHNVSDERIIRSLQDSLAAQELRLANYERAQRNAEFIHVELDRIEAKIHALTESSVNRQDPDFLTHQIDSVTASMQSTEKAISELNEITGLVDEMQEPPAILEADFGKVTN